MRAKLLWGITTLCLALGSLPAAAALFVVDTTLNDLSDLHPGDGECAWATFVPVGQRCTLRAAVAEANALPGPDVILMPANMVVVLSNGQIEIYSDVTIGSLEQGDARPVVDANHQSRIFRITEGQGTSLVTIGNLVLQGGRALEKNLGFGGAIWADSGDYELSIVGCDLIDNAAGDGGAIVSWTSQLQIVDSTFAVNFLEDPVGGGGLGYGNAIWVAAGGGTTSIERSTFSVNYSLRSTTGNAALHVAAHEMQILNSTIDLNPQGGVVFQSNITPTPPELTITNSTISNNAEFGIHLLGSSGQVSLSVNDSIIADNDVSCTFDPAFHFISAGYSLDEDGSCSFFPSPDNIIGVDPMLGPLADNGGHTRTKSLLPGSPALDAGNPATPGTAGACLAIDQRGIERPQPATGGVARCDMGAVEVPEPAGVALAVTALLSLVAAQLTNPPTRRNAPPAPSARSGDWPALIASR